MRKLRQFADDGETKVTKHEVADNRHCFAHGCPLRGAWSNGIGAGVPYSCWVHDGVQPENLPFVTNWINQNRRLVELADMVSSMSTMQLELLGRHEDIDNGFRKAGLPELVRGAYENLSLWRRAVRGRIRELAVGSRQIGGPAPEPRPALAHWSDQ